jgi:hypothetical protein
MSALVDGLTVAALVYGTASRRQLRSWVAAAVAGELGLEPSMLDHSASPG